MSVAGRWDLIIATPIGKQAVVLDLRETPDGLSGTATGRAEAAPLLDLAQGGDRLIWRQAITKPRRLNLTFDVTITGDTLGGVSKASRLPSSDVSGARAR